MKLFVLKDEFRTYWVGASNPDGALRVVREYLAKWEKAKPGEIVEALGEGIEIVDAVFEDVPEKIKKVHEVLQARVVYATQWPGDDWELTGQFRASVKNVSRRQPKQRKYALENARRRVRKKD